MAGILNPVRNRIYEYFLQEAREAASYPELSSVPHETLSAGGRLAFAAEEGARPGDSDLWLRIVLRHLTRTQESLGAPGRRRYRTDAMIISQAFVPLRANLGPVPVADRLADEFKTLWTGRSLYAREAGTRIRIITYASVPRELPPDGPWLPVTVETRFSYDERA